MQKKVRTTNVVRDCVKPSPATFSKHLWSIAGRRSVEGQKAGILVFRSLGLGFMSLGKRLVGLGFGKQENNEKGKQTISRKGKVSLSWGKEHENAKWRT